jgi:hypothetical protein
MSPSGSQGTQCVQQDFSLYRRHGYILAERIHVRIPGHTGWILGSYLRDIFQPRHSSFVAMTQLKNYISQPCLTESIYTTFWVILFNFVWIPPDGSNQGFADDVAKVPCYFLLLTYFYRVRDSAPDGSSPRGYIAEIFGYRLKRIFKFAPCTSSRIIYWFYSLLNGFSFYVYCKPPSRRQGKPFHSDRILCTLWSLFASSFSFYTYLFSWYFNSSVLFAL